VKSKESLPQLSFTLYSLFAAIRRNWYYVCTTFSLRPSAVGNTSTNGANCAERLPIILELIGSLTQAFLRSNLPALLQLCSSLGRRDLPLAGK
jgi:hypothetical protein